MASTNPSTDQTPQANDQLVEFIQKARSKGLKDEEIKKKLIEGGWNPGSVDDALNDLIVPTPPKSIQNSQNTVSPIHNQNSDRPIAVVQNLSVRGFEYSIMFLTLWATEFALIWLGLNFINNLFSKAEGTYSYGVGDSGSAFAITLLIVTFPIFAYMFMRLKKAELADPTLKLDPSRRKLTQMTQLVSFAIALGFTVYFLYSVIQPNTDSTTSDSLLQRLLQMLVALIIGGGIFVYYWKEERKK